MCEREWLSGFLGPVVSIDMQQALPFDAAHMDCVVNQLLFPLLLVSM